MQESAISAVIPVYNEAGNLPQLVSEIHASLKDFTAYEIVIVDDGSRDGTEAEIRALCERDPTVRCETHATNRGQSAAIRSGVAAARSPVIAVLDGDGQNDPADIPGLYRALTSDAGVAMVVGERRKRQDRFVRRVSSRVANGVRSRILGDGIRDTGCGLKVFYRNEFLRLPAFDHMHRFLPALVQQQGGRVIAVPVSHRPRRAGESKYGVNNRLWAGIVDLLGILWLKKRRI